MARPTKAELEAERAKFGGLTAPEAGVLYLMNMGAPTYFDRYYARYKSIQKQMPSFIEKGLWDEAAKQPTEAGMKIVRTVAGATQEHIDNCIAENKARHGVTQ